MKLFTYSDIAYALTIEKTSESYDYKFNDDLQSILKDNSSEIKSLYDSNYDNLVKKFNKLVTAMQLDKESFVDPANNYTDEVRYSNLEFRPIHADLINKLIQSEKKLSYQNLLINNKINKLSWKLLSQFFEDFFTSLNFFYANDNEGLHEISNNLLNILKSDFLNHFEQLSITEKYINTLKIDLQLDQFLLDFMNINSNSKIIYFSPPFPAEDLFLSLESYNTFADPNFYIFSSQLFSYYFDAKLKKAPPQSGVKIPYQDDDAHNYKTVPSIIDLLDQNDINQFCTDPNHPSYWVLGEGATLTKNDSNFDSGSFYDENFYVKQDLAFKIELATKLELTRFENLNFFSRPQKSGHQITNSRIDLIESILEHSSFFDLIKTSNQVQPKVKSINSYIACYLNYYSTQQQLSKAFTDNQINESDFSQITRMLTNSFEETIGEFTTSKVINYKGYSASLANFNLLSVNDRTILVKSYIKFSSFESWKKTIINFITLKKDCLHFFIQLYYNSLHNIQSSVVINNETALCFNLLGHVNHFIKLTESEKLNYSVDIIDLYNGEFYQLIKLSSFYNKNRGKEVFINLDVKGYLTSLGIDASEKPTSDSDFFNKLDYFTIKYQSPFSNIDYFCSHFNVADFRPAFPDIFSDSQIFFNKAMLLNQRIFR